MTRHSGNLSKQNNRNATLEKNGKGKMKKQKIQLIILLVILGCAIGAYFAAKAYSAHKEASEKSTTYTALSLSDDDLSGIQNITATNDAGGFNVNHDSNADTWSFADFPDEKVDTTQIKTMTDALSKLTSDNEIKDVTDFTQYGLDKPAMTVTITLQDGSTHKLEVGNYNSQISEYYLRVDDASTVYTISSTIYSDFNVTTSNLVATSSSSSSEETPTEAVSGSSVTASSTAS